MNEAERQVDKQVKIIRSDRGGEYYEKYNETRQCRGPFANHSPIIVEISNAKFLDNCEVSGSFEQQFVEIKEVKV